MLIKIDFNSDEALYVQLKNQIIVGIATNMIQDGDTLPSVRSLAEDIGINMHTVNKAYSVLRQEGFVKLDRRRGAVVAIDINKMRAIEELSDELHVVLAKAACMNVNRAEMHEMVDRIMDNYEKILGTESDNRR